MSEPLKRPEQLACCDCGTPLDRPAGERYIYSDNKSMRNGFMCRACVEPLKAAYTRRQLEELRQKAEDYTDEQLASVGLMRTAVPAVVERGGR